VRSAKCKVKSEEREVREVREVRKVREVRGLLPYVGPSFSSACGLQAARSTT